MLFQLLHHDFDCFVELRVASVAVRGGVEVDFIIWSDADILHFPLPLEAVDRGPRRRNVTAVEQFGISSNSYQTSPGFLADQRTQPGFAEIPRQRVTARA